MSLQTRRPPGHGKRKALVYASDIAQLRRQGHSYAAICEALADAGIVVSISTVRREAMRPPAAPVPWPFAEPVVSAKVPGPPGRTTLPTPDAAEPAPRRQTGRAVAEAFFSAHPSNPLFPMQEDP